MDYIEILGMKFHSFIGHYDEEKQIGNKFNVDLKVKTDCTKAAETDNLKYALDYVELYNLIKTEMQKKCNLVENVTERIKSVIFEKFAQVEHIYIKISKLSPKIGGMVDEVSIVQDINREEYLNSKR